jgi:RNA polymerase sporulation-specific sigma factor
MENEILKLYVEGISYVEIAEMTSRPIKSIDNALQRIKKKVEQIVKDKQD